MRGRFDYIAYYDLDHTILRGNSATFLVEDAKVRGVMRRSQYRHALYLSLLYKLKIGDPVRMINRMLGWLNGLNEGEVRNLCREVFVDQLIPSIRPEILNTMDQHRASSGAVVLLSSATLPICEPVSDYLGMDDVICTRLITENGILTGKTEGPLVYGEEKRQRLLMHCHAHGFDPADAWYYGDSYTDIPVMKAVGNPVAVAPDRLLHQTASSLRWPILAGRR